MTDLPHRARRLLGSAVGRYAALAVAVAATAFVPRADTGALYPPPFVFDEVYGRAGFNQYTGVVGIAGYQYARALTEPIVVVGARPLRVDPGLEVMAVRVLFFGEHSSVFGYRRAVGPPLLACWDGPVTGHGSTYPPEGLKIGPGDLVYFLVYARTVAPGRGRVSGLRLDYTTRNGVRRSAETPVGILEIIGHPRDQPLPRSAPDNARCRPVRNEHFARPSPGYPL